MLVSLDEMKTYLGISSSSYDDFLIQQGKIISDAVEAYCRRKFKPATYTQTFYCDNNHMSSVINLFAWPVIGVTSISQDGDTVDTSEYRVHKPTGTIFKKNGYFFSAEETVIIYEAGFESVPNPVKSSVLTLIQERYNKKASGVSLDFGSDVQRISIPGTISIDFDYSLSNNDRTSPFGTILGSQQNVLDFYRTDRAVMGNDKIVWVEEG